MSHWTAQFVGIPFEEKGRTKYGADCFGFVRLVLREQFAIYLDDVSDYAHSHDVAVIIDLVHKAAKNRAQWQPVAKEEARPGDVVVLAAMSPHLGVVADDELFLHCEQGKDAVLESLESRRWSRRIVEILRYVGGSR